MVGSEAMDADTVADDLFAATREEFTPLRGEWVKRARAEGNTDLAEQIRQLRKPTVAAWLVNQVSREHPDDVARLAELGTELREAHRTLAGEQLRTLSRRRHDLLRTLTRLARAVASEAGQPFTEATSDQIQNTWAAAVADKAAAEVVAAAQLSTALTPDSPEDWLTAGTTTTTTAPTQQPKRRTPEPPPTRPEPTGDSTRAKQKAAKERARQAVTDAEQEANRATQEAEQAEQDATEAATTATNLHEQLAALTEQLAELRSKVSEADRAERRSQTQALTARKAATAAARTLQEAQRRLTNQDIDNDN
jgi:hypothetical protein